MNLYFPTAITIRSKVVICRVEHTDEARGWWKRACAGEMEVASALCSGPLVQLLTYLTCSCRAWTVLC